VLPSSVVRDWRTAHLDEGLLVATNDAILGVPLGRLFARAAPGVLVPLGTRLTPALDEAHLARLLGTSDGSLCVWSDPGLPPVRIAGADLAPALHLLVAPSLGAAKAGRAGTPAAPVADVRRPPEIVHDALGPFPLWGLD
jgi:hypothetical protein